MAQNNPFRDYNWQDRARDDHWPAGAVLLMVLIGGLMSVI